MKGIGINFTITVIVFFLPLVTFAQQDTLRYNVDEIGSSENLSNLDLSDAISKDIQYNPETGEYEIITKIGDIVINEESLTPEEYQQIILQENIDKYWRERADYDIENSRGLEEPDLSKYTYIPDSLRYPFFDVTPFGSFDVVMGYKRQNIENPTLPIRQRTNGNLDFDMNIQMGITGKIAERLNFDATYNTETNFNFNQNQFKVGYEGKEDDILQEVSFGNVSLPLRSSLIQGNQSLLGVKTTLQFGRLTATTILSQQESQQQGLTLEGGSQKRNFEVKADEYEENRHFFLSHYFRDRYEDNLATLPALNTPYNITRLQVWVTNRTFQTNNIREFIAYTDLGEPVEIYNPNVMPVGSGNFTDNDANSLYRFLINAGDQVRQPETATNFLTANGYEETSDFEIITGRLLQTSEYNFNRDLGYVSLNRSLSPDEVLAVAFEYTDLDGNVRRVGEFSESLGLDPDTDQDQLLNLKLLKPKAPRTDLPTWDLMMKNIYPLGAFQLDQQDFRLDIYYNDPGDGLKRYLPVEDTQPIVGETPLIRVLRLDRFNSAQIAQSDGVFDFLPGYTIDTRYGRLIFPVLEPFGDYLRDEVLTQDNADTLAFDELYDLTKTQAQQFPEFNRYTISGSYKSESRDEISLGAFNIPRGSVTVTAGGRQLVENADYTIDYNLGRIKIINSALVQSGVPLNVQYENNLQFGFQSKRLAGTRLDYYVNEKMGIGGTFLNLRERPFSDKVNLGNDPINNSVLGLDVTYQSKSPWLTRTVDKIPFIDTKAESSVNIQAEVARFIPGHASQIGKADQGQVFVDDFEGASSFYDLKFPTQNWTLASTPQRFQEATLVDDVEYGYHRSKLSWYMIDPILNSTSSRSDRPSNIDVQERSDIYGRQVLEKEVFPNIVNEQRVTVPLNTLDLSYYPSRRGPYNFNVADLNPDGTLDNPDQNWGGIMREINVTDFQAANVEFLEFWLMDPFIDTDRRPTNSTNSGKLVFNLGNVSEDILRDSKKFFENGLPEPGQTGNLEQSAWGNVPTVLNINNAFAADPDALRAQDVGFDGLDNEGELSYFESYLNDLAAAFGTNSQAYMNALNDPSADDFHHFLGDDYDAQDVGIVDRYESFTNPHGNSSSLSQGSTAANQTNVPDNEDVNRDNSLERTEAYYEYEIDLSPSQLQVGQNFIVSKTEVDTELANGQTVPVNWYQFKVPIDGYTDVINNFQGIQSMRFMRMYLTDFEHPTTLRFGRLQLLRNQWRRYQYEFSDNNPPVNTSVGFNVFPVNIEENANKSPIPYVLPPGVVREQIQGAANSFLRNEQSLAMNICALPDGDARGIYKLTDLDIRLYEKLKMYVHAESLVGELELDNDDLELIVRVGSDFSQNYYEYIMPLTVTDLNASDPFSIWPEENNVDIGIQDWVNLKRKRNADNTADRLTPYYNDDGTLAVRGTPDLGRASYIMVAVRNIFDDKLAKCTEVWINELRLSGFNEEPGTAALARADFQLADFGNVSFSGNMHTAGYGSLEQQVQDRYRDDLTEFDISGDFDLDKFLPAETTVRLPVFASYSKLKSTPQYNPYETDLLLSEEPDSIKSQLEEEVEIKTINFSNVRKERKANTDRKPKVYDISNFNVSYSYTQRDSKSAILYNETDKTHYGALGYNYSPQPKPIRPFYTLIKDQKYLKWLKDFNLNPIPSSLGFNTDMRNQWRESALRDIQTPSKSLETFYFKDWVWNRNYNLGWDITNSIGIDFQASNQSRIDQPNNGVLSPEQKDTVWNNVKSFGRNLLYNHNADVSYNIPFDKVPIFDFMSGTFNYGTTYQWLSAPLEYDTQNQTYELNQLGSAIQNTQGFQFNSTLDFNKLYNKSKFLAKYSGGNNARTRPRSRTRPVQQQDDEEPQTPDNENEEDKKSVDGLAFIMKPLLSLKRVSFQYADNRDTFVPGFTESPDNFGVNLGTSAPGWDFVFGNQPGTSWLDNAAQNNWITNDPELSYLFSQGRTKQFSADASLQPFDDFTIDVNLDYSDTEDYNELFRNTGTVTNPDFQHINPYYSGNYDISFISMNTIFSEKGADGVPLVFRDFENNRIEASQILGDLNPDSNGDYELDNRYREGYGPYAQEVLLPSFVAAYTGKSVSDVELNPFDTKPLPNWKFSYTGLTQIPVVSKAFSSIRLSHAYTGNFSINQYNSNLKYEGPEDYFLPTALDSLSYNYFAYFYIPQVTITERFSPLAGLDFTMNNGFTGRLNYTKSRTLGMSLLDYQLSESNSTSFTFGAGYQARGFTLPFKLFGAKELDNDLRFQFDFGIQDDESINYKLDQDTVLPTRGARTINIFPTIDYALNQRVNMQLYYEYRKSEPKTLNSYPITNNRGGMKFSYTFGR